MIEESRQAPRYYSRSPITVAVVPCKKTGNVGECLDIDALKRKLEHTESAMTKIIARMTQIVPKDQVRLLMIYPATHLIVLFYTHHPLLLTLFLSWAASH